MGRSGVWRRLAWHVHAFPRAWRDCVRFPASDVAGFRGRKWFQLDKWPLPSAVCVSLAGDSVVSVPEGLPEGGYIGPSKYCMLPDRLAAEFDQRGLGAVIVDGGGGAVRVPCLLHCDDQFWIAGCGEELRVMAGIGEAWCDLSGNEYHAKDEGEAALIAFRPDLVRTPDVRPSLHGKVVPKATTKVYLGVPFCEDLSLRPHLDACAATARACAKPLVAQVAAGEIPWPIFVELLCSIAMTSSGLLAAARSYV